MMAPAGQVHVGRTQPVVGRREAIARAQASLRRPFGPAELEAARACRLTLEVRDSRLLRLWLGLLVAVEVTLEGVCDMWRTGRIG